MKCLVVALLLCACTEVHDGSRTEFQNTDCTTCHSNNLVHPEALFPLMSMGSPHTNIQCVDCHVFSHGPGLKKFHADCTSTCHLQTQPSACCSLPIEPKHLGRVSPIDGTTPYAWDATNHDFCLKCHPAGLF